jgi:hypothetical protein
LLDYAGSTYIDLNLENLMNLNDLDDPCAHRLDLTLFDVNELPTATQRAALLLGRGFDEVNALHQARNNPNLSVGDEFLNLASAYPHEAQRLISEYSLTPLSGNKIGRQHKSITFLTAANAEVVMLPAEFTPREQAAFLRGYYLQAALRQRCYAQEGRKFQADGVIPEPAEDTDTDTNNH